MLAAVMFGAVLLMLLLSELVVRLAAPQQLIQIRPELWRSVDSLGWMKRPDVTVQMNTGERTVTIHTDRDGNRVGAAGRTEAPTQVLLVGDSFMEALQVNHEQTVAHLWEEASSRQLGRPIAVRNSGVAGWGPNQYLVRARQMLQRERSRWSWCRSSWATTPFRSASRTSLRARRSSGRRSAFPGRYPGPSSCGPCSAP
jgi:hypothetical protein